ncbi:hypothetical protein EYB26_001756 [Talaromyces marneffei]|uniref:Uncharacterized protein YkgE n=1 Tax=Talaromyces marneffei PM1 TaxID=1077442 RepID=A0A093V5P8_TALMA|nr:uncharacterized protein EYB26_001756 [Talaromyces marneffei]QGA14103.1 hypothetical protein EYB26_001756 [Talaromyces marneffei]
MFLKSQVLSLISLIALPLAVNGNACNMHFYSGSGCSGSPVASCVPEDTEPHDYCQWNTWVGSIGWTDCRVDEFPVIWGCDGVPSTNANYAQNVCPGNRWLISTGNGYDDGCSDVGTYDGYVTTGDDDPNTCTDCIGP